MDISYEVMCTERGWYAFCCKDSEECNGGNVVKTVYVSYDEDKFEEIADIINSFDGYKNEEAEEEGLWYIEDFWDKVFIAVKDEFGG